MNKIWTLAMMMLLTAGFAACSDSDDENNNGGTTPSTKRGLTEEQMMQRTAVASVLNKLTGETFCDTMDVDFEGRTFEPTIGVVRNESRPSERSIQVRTEGLAEGYFRSLVGGASELITETDDGCKIDLTNLDCHSTGKKQSLGTLTFHRASGGDNVGYADIDIACIPDLQRISYKTRDQWGDNDNGFVSPISWGEIYVGEGLYWICVREATSYVPGVLINMQSGKGDNWKPLYNDEKWAAWEPADHLVPEDEDWAVLEYVHLSGSRDYAAEKQNLMENYPAIGKQVFPEAYGWNLNNRNGQWELWHYNDPGFSTTDIGYCHRAVYPPAERGIVIVMECTEAGFNWNWLEHWRRWRIYCTGTRYDSVHNTNVVADHSLDIRDASELHRVDYMYMSYKQFYWFPYFACIYTARYKAFHSIPPGYVKVDISN